MSPGGNWVVGGLAMLAGGLGGSVVLALGVGLGFDPVVAARHALLSVVLAGAALTGYGLFRLWGRGR